MKIMQMHADSDFANNRFKRVLMWCKRGFGSL
jgi:hypothetical protein